jgi:secreted trypsin-like serine protease
MRLRTLRLHACGYAVAVVAAMATTGAATGTAAAEPTPHVDVPKIIGGTTVASAPWSAQVYRNGSFTCSGTIIAAQWVLTARHCVGSAMSVRVGSVMRGQGTAANVSSYAGSPYGDVALLRLDRTVATSYSPLSGTVPPNGSTNSIYGWGQTSYNGPIATQLKTAQVRVSNNNARDAYGGRALSSTRITGNAWRGDSGGPQTYNGAQVGVASTADGRSTQQYASLSVHLSWIRQTAGI